MRAFLMGAVFAAAILGSGVADAKGCLKGALVGGVAGHVAGHGALGAAAGCVVGRHQANKKDRQQQANPNGQPSPQ